MIKTWLIVLVLVVCPPLLGQAGFTLPSGVKKEKIPFKLVNNLPIISVGINGKALSFILDTGVSSSIYFGLTNSDSISFKNTSPVLLRGLGPQDGIAALRSTNNRVEVGKAIDRAHSLFIISDIDLNLSSRMGIPIHGILGNDFFKNFIVNIDYNAGKIIIYTPDTYNFRKKCKRCEEFPVVFNAGKPYLNLKVFNSKTSEVVMLLIDSGSSDVIWLFDRKGFINDSPKNYFEDFLGLGLSGDIYGKRSRLDSVSLGGFKLDKINVAFPDEEAISKARSFEARDGSIGGGFLSRFTVTFDYRNKRIFLKKNRNFRRPFNYNMSGLTLEHKGLDLVISEDSNFSNTNNLDTKAGKLKNSSLLISLIPNYVVVDMRPGSTAEIAGVQIGDAVMSVNGKPSYQCKLYEILGMFTKKEGKKIRMEIERQGKVHKIEFILKNPIP